jgi:branched-chain amino acid aminotransferase
MIEYNKKNSEVIQLENYGKFFLFNNNVKECREFEDTYVTEGKSLYEVIRIVDSIPLFLERHLCRLENSARVAGLELWIPMEDIKRSIIELIHINRCSAGNMKLVFNYGEHENNFLMYFIKYHYPDIEEYRKGVDTFLFFGERENPNAKIIDMDFRKRIDTRIKEKSVFEAILVDRNGNITEGSRSNIFFIKDSELITAPVEQVLPGTTRQVIMEIALEMGIDAVEKKVNYRDIDKFDAVFISGTSPKVLPVRSIDDVEFTSSQNKIVIEIMRAYDRRVNDDIKNLKCRGEKG